MGPRDRDEIEAIDGGGRRWYHCGLAVAVGFAALGAYLGRDLSGATGLVLFLGAFACIFGLDAAAAKGHALLAEQDGTPVAAIALTTGALFADPLLPPKAAAGALRLSRYQLLRQGGNVAPLWARRHRR